MVCHLIDRAGCGYREPTPLMHVLDFLSSSLLEDSDLVLSRCSIRFSTQREQVEQEIGTHDRRIPAKTALVRTQLGMDERWTVATLPSNRQESTWNAC